MVGLNAACPPVAGTTELQPAALESGTEAIWYFPSMDAHGADSFEYRATDCPGNRLRSSVPATVSVQVAPVNDQPRVPADLRFPSASTANPGGALVTLPAADVDDNDDQLQLVLLSLPSRGSLFQEDPTEEPAGLIDDDADEGEPRASCAVHFHSRAAPAACAS